MSACRGRAGRRAGLVLAAVLGMTACSGPDAAGPATTAASTTTVTTAIATAPALADDQVVALAVAALAADGEVVGPDREPVVKRSATVVEVAFPTRSDLPPRVGGEPHVRLDPATGQVQRIFRTR